jgi:hypothetical protein
LAALAGLLFIALTPLVQANTPQPQFHIGRFWQAYEYDGAEGWSESCWQYPAGIAKPNFTGHVKRDWVGQGKKYGSYLWTTAWTDPEGTAWQHAMSYAFRSYNYNYPNSYTSTDGNGNMNYVYPVSVQEIMRWDRPTVTIVGKTSGGADSAVTVEFFTTQDGLDSVVYKMPDNGGVLPRPAVQVDPNLVAEEVIDNTWRFIQGVQLDRRTYAYPYGSAHQDYIIWDMTLTNNGISGNRTDMTGTEAWVMSNNAINNMVYGQAFDVRAQSTDGIQADGDAAVVYPFGAASHPAAMFWDTDHAATDGPDWGDPSINAGYNVPQLLDNNYGIIGCLFASTSATSYDVDDVAQPGFIMATLERGVDLKGDSGYPSSDPVSGPPDARLRVFGGAYQLNVKGEGDTFQNDARFADVVANNGGPTLILGYGPMSGTRELANFALHGWDLAQSESVRFVQLMAAGGIDVDEASRIASAYREAAANSPTAPETWMSAADIALVQSGEDTVMKAAALAYWNFNGQFPANVTADMLNAWNIADYVASKPAGHDVYDVPEAPRPPEFIFAHAIADNWIQVVWGKAAETAPDHDTGVLDLDGYRVYRQEGSNNGMWELVADFNSPEWASERSAETVGGVNIPAGRYFNDNDITPGSDYHYCVVAYDDGSQNWAQPGVALESTRWWTWTGYSAVAVTAPNTVIGTGVDAHASAFALNQNTPNPFNPTTSIQFSVPTAGNARLVVYNAAGQVVRTLVDGVVEAGSHEISWDGTDNFGRSVASGVYMYRLTSGDRQTVRRMTLVR